MPLFNIRVEMHDADRSDYQNLADFMTSANFRGYITATDGVTYELPPGEYACEVNQKIEDVYKFVVDVVKKIGPNFAVRVTQGQTHFGGLKVYVSKKKSFFDL